MQLKNSTDYAIRIVCYLAAQERMVSTSELSRKLNVSANYVPKIAKKLKDAKIVTACEGTNGGYMLAKQPENISLMDIISCVEETMAINRCLEEDRFCSRSLEDTCKIHKILLSLQNTYNNKLESVKVSDVIRPGEDEYFGRLDVYKRQPYIYTERNGIYIIDLQKSVGMVDDAYKAVSDIAAEGGTILFVGTKKQAQDAIKTEAERCGMFYVNERWLGGMLTNFKTIQSRIARLKDIERMAEDGTFDVLPKKEVIELKKEWEKLEKNLDVYKRQYQGQGNNRDRSVFSDLCHEYSDAAQRV